MTRVCTRPCLTPMPSSASKAGGAPEGDWAEVPGKGVSRTKEHIS